MSRLTRREFSVAASLAAAGWLTSAHRPARVVAGPFTLDDVKDFPVPADKRLDAQWVASLTARGEATAYSSRRDELAFIGMPIGGICAGHVYLGGDGRLWHWDVFNEPPRPGGWADNAGSLYAKPAHASSPMLQGFALDARWEGNRSTRAFDISGWSDITFRGEYPIGRVEYREPGFPLEATLDAFSPFCPLDAEDSALPATVMEFTVRNTSDRAIDVGVAGWLQNIIAFPIESSYAIDRVNTARIGAGAGGGAGGGARLSCSARLDPAAVELARDARPDIVFETFESDDYRGWTTTGVAFGKGPRGVSTLPAYMGPVNPQGRRIVNSHRTQDGEDVVKADAHTGTLTSPEFVIERHFISFLLGGGNHPGKTCVNLVIDGRIVRSDTGADSNVMRLMNWDVREFAGQRARIQVVDDWTGGWGNVGFDDVVFCDVPRNPLGSLEDQPEFGTMSLALLPGAERAAGDSANATARSSRDADEFAIDDFDPTGLPAAVFDAAPMEGSRDRAGDRLITGASTPRRPVGAVGRRVRLEPNSSVTFTFAVAWHFARPRPEHVGFLTDGAKLRRHYAKRLRDADAVLDHLGSNIDRLASRTRLWRATWYDESTLPHWFLERTLLNASTLATATCLWFDNGRFYGWEGTYCCPGTCTHVWQYAHSVARLFPSLERATREMIDFGLAFREESGAMDYRAEAHRIVAHDGHAGTILRALREHRMSVNDSFLRRVWPRVKKATELLIREDANGDGVLEGAQYNTLDAAWYGAMSWISSLYLGALRAAAAMGDAMAGVDPEALAFAERCRSIADAGSRAIVERLYNGEYFIHRPDPSKPEANSTNDGCHIDQVFGQSWAFQVGLSRVLPAEQTRAALRSLWLYNFAPDVGPYRKAMERIIQGGRWYAMPGEGGLLMCTFPRGGADRATGKGADAWAAGYFNECMNGFEYQVAGHMIWEADGDPELLTHGMAITRAIHDRYHASRRNPWNEVECSNHYARSMASHGVYLALCGYEYDGPRGYLGFAPRLSPENFRAAFTAAEGWGVYSQTIDRGSLHATITLRDGSLRLKTIGLDPPKAQHANLATGIDRGSDAWSVKVTFDGREIPARIEASGGFNFSQPKIVLNLSREIVIDDKRECKIILCIS
jgi:non-lysosomal glucosylceramidase